jgi:PIN domain nuclease of toxin-antitoxin system
LLLDTHSFLWFILDNPMLSAAAKAAIEDPASDVLVSPASYWEIAIKIALGKLALPQPYQPFFEEQFAVNQLQILPIEIRHTAQLTRMPHHHRDPFDRLIIAQAIAEGIPVVSREARFDAYGVHRMW